MQLITDEQRAQLLANGAVANCLDHDPIPVLRLFTPNAGAAWLLTELDPTDPDLAFGLCDFGLGYPELGYVRLSEILSVTDALGLAVHPDQDFSADRPLSQYAAEARSCGAAPS